jgi:hypothetical protein
MKLIKIVSYTFRCHGYASYCFRWDTQYCCENRSLFKLTRKMWWILCGFPREYRKGKDRDLMVLSVRKLTNLNSKEQT